MPIRFRDTELWREDWFVDAKGQYQHLIEWVYDHCDYAGVWRPNISWFKNISGFNDVTVDGLFEKINAGTTQGNERVVKLAGGQWFIRDFISFQYFNKKRYNFTLNCKNNLHRSIYRVLQKYGVQPRLINGLTSIVNQPDPCPAPCAAPLPGAKDKVKVKEKLLGGSGGNNETTNVSTGDMEPITDEEIEQLLQDGKKGIFRTGKDK